MGTEYSVREKKREREKKGYYCKTIGSVLFFSFFGPIECSVCPSAVNDGTIATTTITTYEWVALALSPSFCNRFNGSTD